MSEWKRLAPKSEYQICVIYQNGIEYNYPERILQLIFNTQDSVQDIVDGYLKSSDSSYNGIQKSKTELSQLVAQLLVENIEDGKTNYFLPLIPCRIHKFIYQDRKIY